MAASWTLVRSPKHAEKMLIQLISATGPSWPAVHCHGLSAALNCGLPLCGERCDFYFGLKMCSLMIYLIETINGWTEKILKVLVVK